MKVTLIQLKNDQIRMRLEFINETRVLFLYPNDAMALAAALLDKVQNPDSPDRTVLEVDIDPVRR